MLKQKALTATLWSGADMLLRQFLRFGVSVVLARLLSPGQFGTVAMLALFTGLAAAFVDSGFSSALIQRQDITRRDESTVFWFNLGVAALVGAALWASGPLIAGFYNNPLLTPLAAAFGVNLAISALGSVQNALLIKRLDFRTGFKIGIVSVVGSSVIAIAMAAKGFGVWALVAQVLSTTALSTIMVWVWSPWRPEFAFSAASLRRLFAYGGYILAAGLLNQVCTQLNTLVIGKLYSAPALGQYSRADTTQQVPMGMVTGLVMRVGFATFAAAAADVERLRRGFRQMLSSVVLVNTPVMLGIAATAKPLVLVVFGEKWRPAIALLQVLCLGGLLAPFSLINLELLMALGRSKELLRLRIVQQTLTVALLLATAPFGIVAIAWSQVALGICQLFLNGYLTGVHLKYNVFQQVMDNLPTLSIAVVMAAGVVLLGRYLNHPTALNLGIQVATGGAVFVALCAAFRVPAFLEAAQNALGALGGLRRRPEPVE